jgi:hypothetical protein
MLVHGLCSYLALAVHPGLAAQRAVRAIGRAEGGRPDVGRPPTAGSAAPADTSAEVGVSVRQGFVYAVGAVLDAASE